MQLTGAELIIELLERQGVRIVAGIPGGALLPLYEALGRARVLKHVLVRHEQAGGFVAQGMARISGKAGVCFATSGPGVTNAITAIADENCGQGALDNARCYDAATALLASAERPVLYAGGGVIKARAHHLLRRLAERADLPVTTTLMALGALPNAHHLNLGMLGMHGARHTNMALDECDLLIAIGARFDDRATGLPAKFVRHARIVHIDIDAREFGKIKPPTLAILADAHSALQELLKRTPQRRRTEWLHRIAELRATWPPRTPNDDDMFSPHGIVRAIGELAPADAIVTTDVGQHQMWVAQAFAFQRPDRWLTSGGLGTMGFGLPAAIGAALVEPAATTLCFTGDGSLLMNIQELATLAELDLNVKLILLDNAALGLVRQQQELFYAKRFVASVFPQPSNFVAIARAFGVPALDLASAADPRRALAQAMSTEGPLLIRVPIAAEHHVLPMVAPGTANTEALDYTGPGELAAGNLAG